MGNKIIKNKILKTKECSTLSVNRKKINIDLKECSCYRGEILLYKHVNCILKIQINIWYSTFVSDSSVLN